MSLQKENLNHFRKTTLDVANGEGIGFESGIPQTLYEIKSPLYGLEAYLYMVMAESYSLGVIDKVIQRME